MIGNTAARMQACTDKGNIFRAAEKLADDYDIPTDVPYRKLKKKHLRLIQQGVPERNFGGLDGFFAWLDRKKYKMHVRVFMARYRSYVTCMECGGSRLRQEARWVVLGGEDARSPSRGRRSARTPRVRQA